MNKLFIGKQYTITRINLTKTFIMVNDIQSWFRIENFYSKTELRKRKLKKIFNE